MGKEATHGGVVRVVMGERRGGRSCETRRGGGGETGRGERGIGGGYLVEDNLEGGGRVGQGVVSAEDLVHV